MTNTARRAIVTARRNGAQFHATARTGQGRSTYTVHMPSGRSVRLSGSRDLSRLVASLAVATVTIPS